MAEGVIALTPRQVLLRSKNHHSVPAASSSCAASIMTNNNNNEDDDSNKIGGNVCLLHSSIANYFKHNGFSNSLKSFLKESSSLQKDDLQDDSINLEHIYSKYLEACDNSAKNVNKQKEKVPGKKSEDMAAEPVSSSVKYEEKKKGKRNSDSVGQVVNSSDDNILRESPIDDVNEYKNNNEKKKKNKSVSESVASRGEQHPLGSLHGTKEEKLKDHASSEQKGETDFVEEDALKIRKKKSKRTLDSHVDGVERGTENLKGTGSENLNDIGKSTYNGSTTDKKGNNSKKRKSHSSKENGLKLGDGVTAEKSKCNITKDQQNPENVDQPAEENTTLSSDGNKCKGSSERVDLKASKKTPINELDGQHNGKYENSGQKSASQRTSKKQHESSAEPKTVNVFQRVKVDEVVITDERLKDNSYWAKDGADSGYGAKAQEILGQVRGRDFRHEKTKKKRGSYRGGQIDLQAHSIKFNNSDEDV